jgi:hypothetical protein
VAKKAKKKSAKKPTKKTSVAGPRRDWTEADLKNMKTLVKQNTPTRLIAMKLERTVTSVYGKAAREGISLAPTNRSPRD